MAWCWRVVVEADGVGVICRDGQAASSRVGCHVALDKDFDHADITASEETVPYLRCIVGQTCQEGIIEIRQHMELQNRHIHVSHCFEMVELHVRRSLEQLSLNIRTAPRQAGPPTALVPRDLAGHPVPPRGLPLPPRGRRRARRRNASPGQTHTWETRERRCA